MRKHLNTLYITKEKAYLSLDGETISIKRPDEKAVRLPLHNIEAIMSFSWDTIASPPLMAACAAKGICLSFCDPHGRLLCRVDGFSHGNVLLRRQQYRMADDKVASLRIAQNMVAGKIYNARLLLQRAVRDKPELAEQCEKQLQHMAFSVKDARKAQSLDALLGIEVYAAEEYFSAFRHTLYNPDMAFQKRTRRPPKDEINAIMSFLYSLLSHDCRSAAEACGLDSAVGFYHQDRPGRASLALDLMEELRAPLADRMARSLVNLKQIQPKNFEKDAGDAYRLDDDGRKIILQSWQERKKSEILHPFLQEKITIGMIPHIQARLLAQHIRGALDEYPPMIWK